MATHVLAFTKLEEAQKTAREFSTDHKVMIVGPTDEVEVKDDGEDSSFWTSDAKLYVLIATTDKIVGPQPDGQG
jgi:hypothetical protein